MTVAIIGAGIAGLTAALALRKVGLDVALYEQAEAFGRVGSAINLTADAVKVLDGAGVGDAVLGDACHAMMPFMAQGAGMGLEDAAVLARCAAANADWSDALKQYERTRIERASTIQLNSHRNEWMKQQGNPDWVYGYDAWSAPLA